MERVREGLRAAISGAPTPLAAADRLCVACVDLLEVDGASISLVQQGASRGTFGSSGANENAEKRDRLVSVGEVGGSFCGSVPAEVFRCARSTCSMTCLSVHDLGEPASAMTL